MNRTIVLLTCLAIAVLTLGCTREENTATGTVTNTATFEPPKPRPGELGTDAMTQTVGVEDGRSENEGGVIVTPDPPVRVSGSPVPPTQTTTTTTTTQTAPPPRREP